MSLIFTNFAFSKLLESIVSMKERTISPYIFSYRLAFDPVVVFSLNQVHEMKVVTRKGTGGAPDCRRECLGCR